MGEEDDNQWHDPLLLTDVVSRQQLNTSLDSSGSHTSQTLEMSKSRVFSSTPTTSQSPEMSKSKDVSSLDPTIAAPKVKILEDIVAVHQSLEILSPQRFCDLIKGETSKGRSMLGFSLSTPDLVVCAGSPDIPRQTVDDATICTGIDSQKEKAASIVLSLDEGINGVETKASMDTQDSSKFVSFWQSSKDIGLRGDASIELASQPASNKVATNESAPANDANVVDQATEGSHAIGDFEKLQREYAAQQHELGEARKAIDELRREYQTRDKECQQALNSLHELHSELMRKSMHVGSLAFAVEGQVKEKSKWFSALNDLKRQLKMLKIDHINLSEEALKYKSSVQDICGMNSTIQATIAKQVAHNHELKMKITEGEKQRKELYNKVLELKGNIRVFCRCRPLHTEEIVMGAKVAIDFESAKDGELTIRSNGCPRKTFKFDAVFCPQTDQAAVFEDTAPFATSVLDGYNVCIFAYGQTGTGKTFTMEGTEEDRGVNYRTLAELFRLINDRQNLFRYEICVSALEVYNEQIRDLLAPGTQPAVASKRLEIKQASEGVHHVPGLTESQVNNMSEVWDVLQTGSNARAVGATNANEYSSRSHCIHCVMVKGENILTGECTKSKLWLVDLAGSERIAKTEAQGERLREAQNINRSLAALGDVIFALANKSAHVPFRNSKLTHLLQDSLGGDSKALMFVQISPNENDLSETLCSLNFASRVKGVELGPARKQLDNAEFLRYKQLVDKTRQETKLKDVQIKKMEEALYNMEAKVKDKDQKNKNLQEKVRELEAQLLVERKLARQHVDTKIAEQQQQQQRQQFEEQNSAPVRPPLVAKPLESLNNTHDLTGFTPNTSHLLTDLNSRKTPTVNLLDAFDRQIETLDKENNPDIGDLPLPPKKTGRASLCPTMQRIPASNPRRNSLIPFPNTPMTLHPSVMLPLQPQPLIETKEENFAIEAHCLPEPATCSPVAAKNGVKKLNSVLRRSQHKKMKSPLQQQLRKGGVNVGNEKVRVSIGSRARLGQKMLLGTGRRVPTRAAQKQIQKEKERGWNF